MRSIFLALVYLLIVLGSQSASAAKLCLSDDELNVILIPGTLRSFGGTPGRCIGRFKDLAVQGRELASELDAVYRADSLAASRQAIALLEAKGLTAKERETVFNFFADMAAYTAEQFSKEDCLRFLNGLHVFVVAQSFAAIQTIAKTSFPQYRKIFLRCEVNK